jgi:hypothetical protein
MKTVRETRDTTARVLRDRPGDVAARIAFECAYAEAGRRLEAAGFSEAVLWLDDEWDKSPAQEANNEPLL